MVLLCSSFSPQANVLLDNVAPTYQAVAGKQQGKRKVWGLDRSVLRMLEPKSLDSNWFQEEKVLRKILTAKGKKKSRKYFQADNLKV